MYLSTLILYVIINIYLKLKIEFLVVQWLRGMSGWSWFVDTAAAICCHECCDAFFVLIFTIKKKL